MIYKIAIIGAGPAGCMLARLISLSDKEISVTIFEGEQSINYRSQGGTLDLRTGAGIDAIKAAKLWDEFNKLARYDGEALKITDKKLLHFLKVSGSKKENTYARPEIDRPLLRKLLFESLPDGCVSWGHKLTKVDQDLTLHFADKPSQGGFDLVVGADGAWSKTRVRLSDDKPFFSGVGGHSMLIPAPAKDHPELFELVNRGSVFSYSDSKHVAAQYMGDGSINVSTWLKLSEDWQTMSGYDVRDSEAVRARYRQDFADWDPKLLALTQVATEHVTPRSLYMLPVGNKWEHVEGVTLIGDAAHLATPFAGQGVNIALQDALLLSKAITGAAEDPDKMSALDRAIILFEKDMFRRAEIVQRMTDTNLQLMVLDKDAPRSGIEQFILGALEDEVGWAMWLLKPLVFAYFGIFKWLYC